MARMGAKLCQKCVFEDSENFNFVFEAQIFLTKNFGSKILFFADLARFWRSHGQTDVKIGFLVKFCFRYTYPEVCMTENHENDDRYRRRVGWLRPKNHWSQTPVKPCVGRFVRDLGPFPVCVVLLVRANRSHTSDRGLGPPASDRCLGPAAE